MRRKGTHFFCFLQISAVKNAEIRKMYPHCAQNTAPYQAEHHHRKIVPLRTKQSIIIARLHHFVPSGASIQAIFAIPACDASMLKYVQKCNSLGKYLDNSTKGCIFAA